MEAGLLGSGSLNSTFSLKPLVDHLQRLHEKSIGPAVAEIATLLDTVARHPEVLGEFDDVPKMGDLSRLGHQLLSTVIPQATWDYDAVAVFSPLLPRTLYASNAFSRIFLDGDGRLKGKPDIDSEIFAKNLLRRAYLLMLQKVYCIPQQSEFAWIRVVDDPDTGLERHFRLKTNLQFVHVESIGDPPVLNEAEQRTILENLNQPEAVQDLLPLKAFKFTGFVVIQAEDITEPETIAAIGKDLIDKDSIFSPTGFQRTEKRLRTLFRRKDLVVRLAAIHGDRILQLRSQDQSDHGRVEKQADKLSISRLFEKGFHRIIDSDRILVVPDLLAEKHSSWVDKRRAESGIRSLLVLPLSYKGVIIGVMDLGSPKANDIGPVDAWLAEDIMPLFALALRRGLDDLDKEVQTIIKQECTAVHPSVEWRFQEVALGHLERRAQNLESKLEPVLFKQVYQLFGTSDVRGSTDARNRAIREDLLQHIELARTILSLAQKTKPLNVLKYQARQIEAFKSLLTERVGTGDEQALISFIEKEFSPILPVFEDLGGPLAKAVDAYRNAVDPSVGTVYRRRRDFEQSILQLNSRMAKFLDQEQGKEQKVFPHYFEKHQTDGLEYLIYLGASMTRQENFSQLYVQNLRLWQIFLACGLAWHAWDLNKTLKIKMNLTHLIIVSQTPLSIRFRFDEKRFDVDGAYDIAHEIIKSRIDKTMVKGGNERLTQPRKIAMIYATQSELNEILRHVELLQNENYLRDEIEYLELEELTDLKKLNAVRVAVDVESQTLARQARIK